MIAIPDSVRFYWHDAVNRAALNVLAGDGEVPLELSWYEAERFELAQLAARRVRVEYRGLLRALWSASWEAAVRAQLPKAKLLSFGGHRGFARDIDLHDTVTVKGVWEKRAVSGVFALSSSSQLFTRLALKENETSVELAFYHWDAVGRTALSDGLDLGLNWTNDGEERRITMAGALQIDFSSASIDPEPLTDLTQEAATALALLIH